MSRSGVPAPLGDNVVVLLSDSDTDVVAEETLNDILVVSSSVIPIHRGPPKRRREPVTWKPLKTAALLGFQQAPPPVPPPQEPVQPGPKCGICMEPMGGSTGQPMASGPCGHVYCYECLMQAVKAQKKCPTCRKTLQPRQIHSVFVQF